MAQGFDEGFVRMYRRCHGPVWRYLRHQGVPTADIPDLVQEVFHQAWTAWRRFDPQRSSERQYLMGIARHVRSQFWRRRSRQPTIGIEDTDPDTTRSSSPGPERVVGDHERRTLILDLLGLLPDDQREVITYRVFEGKTFDEVAKIQGVRRGTAQSRSRLGMEKLKRKLGALAALLAPERSESQPTSRDGLDRRQVGLLTLIDRLPEAERQIVVLRHVRHCAWEQIGSMMGISAENAEALSRQGEARLRRMRDDEERGE